MLLRPYQGGIVEAQFISPVGAVIATLSAGLWVNISILRKTPVSGIHSMIGAIFGYGIVYAGIINIKWNSLLTIGLSWLSSPLLGLLVGFVFYYSLKVLLIEKNKKHGCNG